ncbi:hypothetical protein ALT_8876 [Aspergillus lentulus]|uniref:AT hook motif protein n=1 Tax=Aspergillus lentulus TaxID=293939 RepID=A0AAN4TF74_ASPLE|nr:uncharacterized protein IFM58399_04235 [Aspergillus lentulus]KAF4166729.1 hypothetical protein CNMCM6936_006179 [Aspergillus lentulus]KAF4185174.1 hypothetical protein CNMCM7927_007081 [Aspergillus lentulus]GAQ11555.1 hypothetical protein ALT_8876 [Aspergillus lentulus]GFF35488.1 hypothetical protein IFM58399_04235 [Aspergillus lentulus]GFF60367.1 hypothetical protein IFM62136_04578 [Aspergillus lentulus]
MPMTWDHEADAKLLLRIFMTSNIKLDYEDLAKHMGPDCTTIAIQRRIQRLKMDPRAGSAVNGDSSTPATPEKRKRGRPKKDTNGYDAEEDKGSPKKAKKAKKEENGSAVDSA